MNISEDRINALLAFGRTMQKDDVTPDIERIAGLYPRGFMSITASMAGTGKTWLMQYIACQLSRGGRILGGIVAKSPKYKTLIMSGETGTLLLDKRLAKTCWLYNPERIKVYSAVDMSMAGINCMLNTKEGQENILSVFAMEKPDIVFFDTLISFHTVDESKQGEMTGIYLYLLRLAKAFDCAIVLNHHTRKRPANAREKKFNQEDVIGSSAGVRLASSVYVITAEDDMQGGSTMTVSNVKSWDKKVPEFTYTFIEDEETGLLDFKIDFDTNSKNIFWSLRERVAELVKSFDAGAVLEVEKVAQELKTSKDMARSYLQELAKRNKLEKVKLFNGYGYKVL